MNSARRITERLAARTERAIVDVLGATTVDPTGAKRERAARFLERRRRQMSPEVRLSLGALTCALNLFSVLISGRPLWRGASAGRARRWSLLRRLPLLKRYCAYHEGVFAYCANAGESVASAHPSSTRVTATIRTRCKNVVVGSGPGGTIASLRILLAGQDVQTFEEGSGIGRETERFSPREIDHYRGGGLTFTVGRPMVNLVEARCVGGGGAVNGALYYRTPPEVLAAWRDRFAVHDLDATSMERHFEFAESALDVRFAHTIDHPAREILARGAGAVGLRAHRVAVCGEGDPGVRNVMLSRALERGLDLQSGARVVRLTPESRSIHLDVVRDGRLHEVSADNVFLCAGAVHTPHLLQRSGFRGRVGRTLGFQPVIKVVARFPEPVHAGEPIMPPFHVRDPITGGLIAGSVSTRAHIALNLFHHADEVRQLDATWPRMLVFHTTVHSTSQARVRLVPFVRGPVVTGRIDAHDRANLVCGARRLVELLLRAGAEAVFLNAPGSAPITDLRDVPQIDWGQVRRLASITSYHMSSTCPMGEDRTRCVSDSFGRLFAEPRITICDASALCTAPGVNPQGTIMAVASRNVSPACGPPPTADGTSDRCSSRDRADSLPAPSSPTARRV